MPTKKGKPWYKNPLITVPAVVGVVAILVSILIAFWQRTPPTFGISVYPLTGKTLQGEISQTMLTVENIKTIFIFSYRQEVTLEASGPPSGMVVTFQPKGGPRPPYDSTMTVSVASDVGAGTYGLTVRAIGGDGQEKTCKYILDVMPRPSPPQKPPSAYIDAILPSPATQGQPVSFQGHGIDPDGSIVSYQWRSSINGPLSGLSSFNTSNLSIGTHTIYFKVQDNQGLWSPEVNTTLAVNPAPPPLPSAKINSPVEPVPLSIIISGNFSGKLPTGQYLWVVINPHPSPGQWWPQGRINAIEGRQWNVSVRLGRENEDAGAKFDIAVVVVNGNDDQYYETYLRIGRETSQYPPIPLPSSSEFLDKITVTRK